MLSGDLPVQSAAPIFQCLEMMPSPAVLEEVLSPGCCKTELSCERVGTPEAVLEVMTRCYWASGEVNHCGRGFLRRPQS